MSKKTENSMLVGVVLSVLTYWLFTNSGAQINQSVASFLGVSLNKVAAYLTLAGLFSAAFIIVAGDLSDKFGRLKLMYIGLLFNIIGSFLLVLGPFTITFIIGRMMQGLSAAFIMPSSLSLIKQTLSKERLTFGVTIWTLSSWGGSALTMLISGSLVTYLGWKSIFYCSIMFSLLAFIFLHSVKDAPNSTKTIRNDFVGIFFLVITLFSFNTLLNNSLSWGVFSVKFLGTLAVVIVAFGCLIMREKKVQSFAILDFSLFKSRYFVVSTLSNFLMNAMLSGSMYILPLFIMKKYDYTLLQIGFITLGYFFTTVFFVYYGKTIMGKMGEIKPMILGNILALLSTLVLSVTFIQKTHPITYLVICVIGFALLGMGAGLFATPSTNLVVKELSVEKAGNGSGVYKMASSLGGAIGVLTASLVYTQGTGAHNLIKQSQATYLTMAVLGLISFLLCLSLLKKKA